jgi:opacity protein-like surface antigen
MKKVVLMAILGSFALSVGASEEVVVTEESSDVVDPFSGAYFGLGLGGNFLKNKISGYENQDINRFAGTVVFGGGKTFNSKFYFGGEVLIDFAKSKTQDVKKNGVVDGSIKNRGITPELALRLGFVKADWLFYFKPAILFPKATVKTKRTGQEASTSKAAYSVALGLEKSFCRKFSARLEGEYVFGSKKDEAKFHQGFNLRALFAYNIKF